MADEITYESEMRQPAHRPGMEKVVNREFAPMPIMQGRDKDGNETQKERPTVAPGRIDPFSIKGDGAPKAPVKGSEKPSGGEPAGNSGISGIGGREREGQIMAATEKAVTG